MTRLDNQLVSQREKALDPVREYTCDLLDPLSGHRRQLPDTVMIVELPLVNSLEDPVDPNARLNHCIHVAQPF